MWLEPPDTPVPEDLQSYVGGHPLVAKVLAQRGITSPSEAGGFLDPRLYRPTSPRELPNLALAADRVTEAIRKQHPICVWGDFDVDGQTATTLLVSALRTLGANVQFHIPVRGRESHGIKLEVLKEILTSGTQLVLTCDTGIAEHEALAYAQTQGVDVVVTDHHTLPETLPNAYALVNPQMLPPDHPLRTLPGVGVAYKLAEELFRRAERKEETTGLLDLVALGIVADVAVQRGDTRYLLQKGLEQLRQTERAGLQRLFQLAELNPAQLSGEHIGFAIGPRLNAIGRLGDANSIVEFLTTKDQATVQVIAQQLEGLNAERKLLTSQIYQAALAQLDADPGLLDFAALVLAHPKWEAGVLGIVAGRLAERFHRPVVLLVGENGSASVPANTSIARGSARSVEGINITSAIAEHADMLLTFGGHPMAAGVSLAAEKIPAFRRALSESVERMRGGAEIAPLQIDAFLPLSELSLNLVEEIGRLAPFGAGNPALVLATRNLIVKSSTILGRTKEHLQLFVEDENGEVQKVFWWQGAGNPLPEGRFDLAYSVRASDFRGERQLQIEWVDFRPVERTTMEVPVPRTSRVEWVDHREVSDPVSVIHAVRDRGILIFAEGEAKRAVGGVDRWELCPASELAVWTIPPGPHEWKAILEAVKPEKIYLFAEDEEDRSFEGFIKRLAGLLKFGISAHGGRVEVSVLAASTGQREETVKKGVAWLVERGMFEVVKQTKGTFSVQAGKNSDGVPQGQTEFALQKLLEETRAYRRFWAKASVNSLSL